MAKRKASIRAAFLTTTVLASLVLAGCTAPQPEVLAPNVDGSSAANSGAEPVTNYCDRFKSQPRSQVDMDGSSTVYPIAEAWAERFHSCLNLDVIVGFGGTGAGFKKFCRGEIDVSDASRPIKDAELADCRNAGIEPFEMQVAIDGLAVVVSTENTFVDHLAVTELNRIWTATASNQANTWRDLRPNWPADPIERYGPGTDSGTFDYFIEVIIHPFDGTTSKGRSDYTPSEDDNILVQGVASSGHALGYFGLAYVHENQDKIRAVPIKEDTTDGGKTTNPDAEPVAPTTETVEGGQYKPLARPLFMYTDGEPRDRLLEFFKLGLTDQGQALVEEVGYIKLPAAKRAEVLAQLT